AQYPAVEDIRAVGYNGKLYVFGGAAEAFAGATASAAVYDPTVDTWTMLPSMNTARSGAVVQVLGNLIYVAGGLDVDGASLNSVEVYSPAQNTWGSAPSMLTRRDNPGSAVLDGKLYVFGGRTRAASGSGPGELNTVEMFDPLTQQWSTRAPMPT